jgi:hypothetical protein
MRTEALVPPEFGACVRPGDGLRVTGAFSAAVYLENPRGGIAMLHDAACGRVPFGFGVRDARAVLARAGFRPGQTGRREGDEIRLGDEVFVLTSVPEPPEVRWTPSRQALSAALTRGSALLAESGRGSLAELLTPPSGGPAGPFARAAAPAAEALETALAERDAPALRAALRGLLGLGTGLTPSLDDFVSALCAALLRARDVWGLALPEADLLAAAVAELAPARTTPISAAYLLASAGGQGMTRLADVLRPLPGLMEPARVRALLEVGAGSGGDMLAGTLFAVRYLLKQSRFPEA